MNIFSTIDESARAAKLDYLVIGGHAVNAHGYFRTTLDVDLQDVVALARLGGLQLSDPEFSAIIEKHATAETSDEIRRLLD